MAVLGTPALYDLLKEVEEPDWVLRAPSELREELGNDTMKGLLIYFDVIDGKQAQFEAAAHVLVSRVRDRDPTYTLYSLSRLKDSTTRYVVVQRFENYETQLAHQTFPYIVETMPAMQACMAGPPTIQFLDILD